MEEAPASADPNTEEELEGQIESSLVISNKVEVAIEEDVDTEQKVYITTEGVVVTETEE